MSEPQTTTTETPDQMVEHIERLVRNQFEITKRLTKVPGLSERSKEGVRLMVKHLDRLVTDLDRLG